MKMIQVIGACATFHNGVLKLSTEQAHARAHALEDLGEDCFEILSPVMFKRGEIVGFDGPVNKTLLQDVEVAEDGEEAPKAPKAANPDPEKPAKAPKAPKAAKKGRG